MLFSAAAPGTLNNRRRQAIAYIKFSILYNFDPTLPTSKNIAMYTQYMANLYTSIATVKNYLSGAKHWALLHGASYFPFVSLEVSEVLKGNSLKSQHVPVQAVPLSANDVKIICNFLDNSPGVIKAIKPCVLITYSCMLRSSNVLSPTVSGWAGAHTLVAKDIRVTHEGLTVIIRSTKTTSRSNPVVLSIPRGLNYRFCPVRAWEDYVRMVKPWPFGPAFIKADGTPLTAAPVVIAMKSALKAAGACNLGRLSMHSLRRGAVHDAEQAGASKSEIMKHGIWRSESGLSYYLKPASSVVPDLLSATLAS